MDLHPAGRDFYTVGLDVEDFAGNPVAIDAATASFDGGETWADGVEDIPSSSWQWMVAGADAPTDDDVDVAAVITAATTQPQVKAVVGTVIIVMDGPTISLKT